MLISHFNYNGVFTKILDMQNILTNKYKITIN